MPTKEDTPLGDKTIRVSVKEILTVAVFLITVGISIGGFIKVICDLEKISNDVKDINKEITNIKVANKGIETQLGILINQK